MQLWIKLILYLKIDYIEINKIIKLRANGSFCTININRDEKKFN